MVAGGSVPTPVTLSPSASLITASRRLAVGRAQGHAFRMAPKTGSRLTPGLGSDEPEYDPIRLPEEG